MRFRFFLSVGLCVLLWSAQGRAQTEAPAPQTEAPSGVTLPSGTHVPLTLINTVSTKHSQEGDRVYLQTAFPVLAEGHIVIPPGSYVMGTLTHLKRPGRAKGKGELFLRFDSLTLPNGAVHDFRGRVSSMDGSAGEVVDRAEGKIRGEGNIAGDARTIGEGAAAGASIGAIARASAGGAGTGAAIGAGAGAVAGLVGVLLTRGPDVVLAQGSTMEMVLDRPLVFPASELTFTTLEATHVPNAPPSAKNSGLRRRLPF